MPFCVTPLAPALNAIPTTRIEVVSTAPALRPTLSEMYPNESIPNIIPTKKELDSREAIDVVREFG